MKLKLFSTLLCLAAGFGANAAFAQANENVDAGDGKFPLAAAAGQDSGAVKKAPLGAVNQGPFDMTKWKYGHDFDPPPGSKIWNPVKIKMMQGGKVTGGTMFYSASTSDYCAIANAGYDFVWTEMQHDSRNWQDVANAWATCPHAKAVPGVRVAYTNEREEQRALDNGALVLVVPTVRSYEEAIQARDWAYFPPLGKRSCCAGQAYNPSMWGNVPGGYRNTMNDNLVLILMIETLDGVRDIDKIVKIPGVTAVMAAHGDLANTSGYKDGTPDFERLINIVHDAAIKAGIRLCGTFAWKDRPDFTCFQAGNEVGNINQGAAKELGALANTQGKPEVGPYAAKK